MTTRPVLVACLVWMTACGAVAPHTPDANGDDPVVAMAVSPDVVSMTRGLDVPRQLTATATLSSGATQDVTTTATWASADPTIATVTAGLVTTVGAGSVTITATAETKAGSATFTITNARMIVTETGTPPAINIFDAFQTGNTAPTRQITGANTTLKFPWSVVVYNDEIYVADLTASAIDVFPVTATGNVAPSRRITTSIPLALAIFNDEIYTATNNGTTSTILVYPITATDNATPTRSISGPATTLLAEINSLAVYNNELYVSSEQSGSANIVVLPVTASGNATATRTISGPQTGLFDIWDLRVVDDEIFVADLARGGNPDPGVPGGTAGIRVFAANADGNATPTRNLSGPTTGISGPIPLLLVGDEVYSVNIETTPGLVVHAKTATGDAAPTRSLGGAMTKIVGPRGITIF